MRKFRFILVALGLLGSSTLFQSCLDDDDDMAKLRPTAIVTVCPNDDGSFVMNLDNNTVLVPNNYKTSPFKDKEVRALANYTETGTVGYGVDMRDVTVNWIDSIRTKLPVASTDDNDAAYGNDPVEIVADWVTVAEDGYITLRLRTRWSRSGQPHLINLVTGVNPDDPFEFELRHNAMGDIYGEMGDALIAFNLNELPGFNDKVKVKLRWRSFSGEKSTELELEMRPLKTDKQGVLDSTLCTHMIE